MLKNDSLGNRLKTYEVLVSVLGLSTLLLIVCILLFTKMLTSSGGSMVIQPDESNVMALSTIRKLVDDFQLGTLTIIPERFKGGAYIRGTIGGLTPGESYSLLILENTNFLQKGFNAADPIFHFNPASSTRHSCRKQTENVDNTPNQHHQGDLGNVISNEKGLAEIDTYYSDLKIENILGRAISLLKSSDNCDSENFYTKKENILAYGILSLYSENDKEQEKLKERERLEIMMKVKDPKGDEIKGNAPEFETPNIFKSPQSQTSDSEANPLFSKQERNQLFTGSEPSKENYLGKEFLPKENRNGLETKNYVPGNPLYSMDRSKVNDNLDYFPVSIKNEASPQNSHLYDVSSSTNPNPKYNLLTNSPTKSEAHLVQDMDPSPRVNTLRNERNSFSQPRSSYVPTNDRSFNFTNKYIDSSNPFNNKSIEVNESNLELPTIIPMKSSNSNEKSLPFNKPMIGLNSANNLKFQEALKTDEKISSSTAQSVNEDLMMDLPPFLKSFLTSNNFQNYPSSDSVNNDSAPENPFLDNNSYSESNLISDNSKLDMSASTSADSSLLNDSNQPPQASNFNQASNSEQTSNADPPSNEKNSMSIYNLSSSNNNQIVTSDQNTNQDITLNNGEPANNGVPASVSDNSLLSNEKTDTDSNFKSDPTTNYDQPRSFDPEFSSNTDPWGSNLFFSTNDQANPEQSSNVGKNEIYLSNADSTPTSLDQPASSDYNSNSFLTSSDFSLNAESPSITSLLQGKNSKLLNHQFQNNIHSLIDLTPKHNIGHINHTNSSKYSNLKSHLQEILEKFNQGLASDEANHTTNSSELMIKLKSENKTNFFNLSKHEKFNYTTAINKLENQNLMGTLVYNISSQPNVSNHTLEVKSPESLIKSLTTNVLKKANKILSLEDYPSQLSKKVLNLSEPKNSSDLNATERKKTSKNDSHFEERRFFDKPISLEDSLNRLNHLNILKAKLNFTSKPFNFTSESKKSPHHYHTYTSRANPLILKDVSNGTFVVNSDTSNSSIINRGSRVNSSSLVNGSSIISNNSPPNMSAQIKNTSEEHEVKKLSQRLETNIRNHLSEKLHTLESKI